MPPCLSKLLFSLALLGGATIVAAQGRAELEARRTQLEWRIEMTSELLEHSSRDRAAAFDRLVGLQSQIRQREALIDILGLEIVHADSSVGRTLDVLASMECDVELLTEEYGRMARAALRRRLTHGQLTFLASAGSLSEAFQRLQYLRQYDENRQRQLELIRTTQEVLARKLEGLAAVRAAKDSLLTRAERQRYVLARELRYKDALLSELEQDEVRLRRELSRAKRDRRRLDGAIGAIIREANVSIRPLADVPTTDEVDGIAPTSATDFRQNKGLLPWPVEKGYISKTYGRQPHPTLRKIEVSNNGVDIRTEPEADALAVFGGVVVGVQAVPGYNDMVIVQHDRHYSVYSNLAEVLVKPGARVAPYDVLGRVHTDEQTGTSELHFEIWEDRTTEDPAGWLR